MEHIEFDAMAKALGARTTRRLTLGALLGGALGRLGLADAEEREKTRSERRARKQRRRSPGVTARMAIPPTASPSSSRRRRASDISRSTPSMPRVPASRSPVRRGRPTCDGVCQDLQTDETNCGACGTSCGAVQGCCNGVCTNLNTDEANCGACGNPCAAGQTCCSGICKNLQADPANCGTCGAICAAPTVICLAGDCCKPPTFACAAPGADATCCSGVCLPAIAMIPFPHCA